MVKNLLSTLFALIVLHESVFSENVQHPECVSREEFDSLKKLLEEHSKRIKELEKLNINNIKSMQTDDRNKEDALSYPQSDVKNGKIRQSRRNDFNDVAEKKQPTFAKKEERSISQFSHNRSPTGYRRQSNGVVAFYSCMTSGESSPSIHHTLIYDHAVTNDGNDYNNSSGIFTAPMASTYIFTWTTFVHGDSYMSIELMQNGNVMGATFPDRGSIHDGTTSSTGVAVLQLKPGDVVFTRTSSIHTPHGSIISTNIYRTTFSGWCLTCHL